MMQEDSIFKQPNPVVASQRVARMRARTSLPGLTRQPISFEKRILAKKDGYPDHPSTPRLRRVFGIGPPKPWRRRKSGHDECVCVTLIYSHSFAISPAHAPRGLLLFSRPPNRGRRECRAADA